MSYLDPLCRIFPSINPHDQSLKYPRQLVNLAIAVLYRSILDAAGVPIDGGDGPSKMRKNIRDARFYIFIEQEDDDENPFTFRNACEIAGVSPSTVRKAAIRIHQERQNGEASRPLNGLRGRVA